MRIIYNLFFIILILFEIQKSARGNENEGNVAVIDSRFLEMEDPDDYETDMLPKEHHSKKFRNFVGTNLFGDCNGIRKKCFSTEDIALLAARKDFESLIPKDLPNDLFDDDLSKLLMRYFYGASQIIDKMTRGHSKLITERAFHDTLGGYLQYYMIPISKYSFYAGAIKLKTVENILHLFSECKHLLNTNGNGWVEPLNDFSNVDLNIEPLRIVMDDDDDEVSCTQLDLLDEETREDNDMLVCLPRLEQEERGLLRNIWLPLKRKHTFDLRSCSSAFILLKYFEVTTKCYKFQNVNQDLFNKRLKVWMLENLEVHLKDDTLYPGLGAILRIIETIRRKGNNYSEVGGKTDEKRHKDKTPKKNQRDKTEGTEEGLNIFKAASAAEDLEGRPDQAFYIEFKESQRRKKYIYIAIAVSLGLVLFVFLVIVMFLCIKRYNRQSDDDDLLDEEPKKSSWFGLRRSSDAEDLPNSKDSKSKKKARKNQTEETTRCCGGCKSKNNESSSLESDSGREKKKKPKLPPAKSRAAKAMVVDEKKRFSISKKNKQKDGADKRDKRSILKKGL